MSEAMQQRLAHSRAERSTTSCGECRRRKQKCDQRSPCGNCARRFPQPVCEYKLGKRIPVPGLSSLPTFTVTLRPERFADREIPGTREPLLGGPEPTPPWAKRLPGGGGGEVVIWSGVDMSTKFPSSAGLAFIGSTSRPPAAGTISSTWNSTLADMPYSLNPGSLVLCDEGCRLHSDAVHDAIKLILHYSSIPLKFLDAEWDPTKFNDVVSFHAAPATGNPWPLGGTAEEMRHLPMAPTRLNGELLRIYLKLLCRFKASIDGNPEPNNPIIKHFVPFCVQDPLLLQIILYTSACFLNETGHLPRQLVMVQKGRVIGNLNEHLRSDAFYTSDAAIAAVVQLIIDEWYWGETQDLRAHLRGIRQMLKIRGGYHKLGMNGLLAKMVIINDIAISLAHEITPFLQSGPGFQFSDPVTVPFRMSHNSPLAAGLASFADCADSLNMSPATASILDDMRFLIGTVLAMPARPTPQQLQKVKTTATWMYERISKLDESIPAREKVSSPKSPPKSPGSPPSAKKGSVASATLDVPSAASRHRSRSRESAVDGKGKKRESDNGRSTGVSSRSHSVSAESITASVGLGEDGTSPRPPSEKQSPPIDPTLLGEAKPAAPDFAYQVVRQAALVYARAVMNRQSLAAACSPEEFLRIWTTTWRVPLSAWRGTCGVFLWIMLSIVTSCLKTPHERFVKSMLVLSLQTLGVDNWHVAYEAMGAGVRLQLWLRGEEAWRAAETVGGGEEDKRKAEVVKGMVGGRKTIDRHGWAQPDLWEDEGQTKCGG